MVISPDVGRKTIVRDLRAVGAKSLGGGKWIIPLALAA